MQRTIAEYKDIMLRKILMSKTQLEVLSVIDRKIKMLRRKNATNEWTQRFLDSSIVDLKNADASSFNAQQWSNIRVAKGHLENLKKFMHQV
jgi:hypothetical protein